MGLGWALPEKGLVLFWRARTREDERTALELNSLIMRTADVSPGLACVRHHDKHLTLMISFLPFLPARREAL